MCILLCSNFFYLQRDVENIWTKRDTLLMRNFYLLDFNHVAWK